jgi:hypothetical protein
MNDAEKQALVIYELICATSGDRPFAFRSMAEMNRIITEWRANNPGLTALRNAGPEVQVAFLGRCFEWLRAETKREWNSPAADSAADFECRRFRYGGASPRAGLPHGDGAAQGVCAGGRLEDRGPGAGKTVDAKVSGWFGAAS